ncbi:MAG: radical SAM protein [Candidatus Methanospirareceae archaeon]
MDLEAEDFLDFTRDKYIRLVKRATPIYGAWEITNACNLRCKNCGFDSGEAMEGELSTEEALDLVDNIKEAGTASLMILGGEPTVRKDLLEIISYASLFMSVAINTNGVLVDKNYARRLADAGLHQVKVSLDGAKADTHDAYRGKGTYDKAIEAIKACKAAGIPSVVIETTISKHNYDELEDIVKLALRLGVWIVVNEFIPFGRGAYRADLLLDKERRRRMQEYLLRMKKEMGGWKINFEDRYIISKDEEAKEALGDPFCKAVCVGCFAGIFGYGIRPNGEVIPCPVLRKGVGNLKEEKLRDIWKNSEMLKTLRNRDKLKGKCGTCVYRFVCGGCRGRTYSLTGDFMAEDPLCWVEDCR